MSKEKTNLDSEVCAGRWVAFVARMKPGGKTARKQLHAKPKKRGARSEDTARASVFILDKYFGGVAYVFAGPKVRPRKFT